MPQGIDHQDQFSAPDPDDSLPLDQLIQIIAEPLVKSAGRQLGTKGNSLYGKTLAENFIEMALLYPQGPAAPLRRIHSPRLPAGDASPALAAKTNDFGAAAFTFLVY